MKTNESGRSMIEMLGVLAIIGVLSVGGIAGYSKAMNVYRVNKTIDQLTQITASTRALFAGHKVYTALSTGGNPNMNLIKKSHLVPDDMIDGDSMVNTYGGTVLLNVANKGERTNKAFAVSFGMIPQDSCIELSTKEWGQGKTSGLWSVKINSTEKLATAGNVTIAEAVAACTSTNNNTIVWTFF